jgi:hypothetical protein
MPTGSTYGDAAIQTEFTLKRKLLVITHRQTHTQTHTKHISKAQMNKPVVNVWLHRIFGIGK